MSNDIIKSLSSLPSVITGLDEDTMAVAGGMGGKRISIKGGVFRKLVGGKEAAKIEERHMQVIFVKMAHNPSRTFYKEAFKEDTKIAPICWSSDSKVPDASVKTPQGANCDHCPRSVQGTGQNGKGTACRLSWRTAVVLPNDPNGDVLQLVLPAASVFGKETNGKYPFRSYIQMLANNNVSAGRVITKMQFDTDSASPKLVFSAAAATPVEDLETIVEQGRSLAAINAVKLTVFEQEKNNTEEIEVAQPGEHVVVNAEPLEAEASSSGEPTLREGKKPEVEPPKDVSDVLKKWAAKKA